MKSDTVRVRMLGNHKQYTVGEAYEVPAHEANSLVGMGIAQIEPDAAKAAEPKEAL